MILSLASMTERPPLSIRKQADFIDDLVMRCVMHDGKVASETTMLVTGDDVQDLIDLANRLRRMAPHENEIRRVVTGR